MVNLTSGHMIYPSSLLRGPEDKEQARPRSSETRGYKEQSELGNREKIKLCPPSFCRSHVCQNITLDVSKCLKFYF